MLLKPAKQVNEEEIVLTNEEYETLDFDNPDFVFRPNEQHEWRQKGPYLVCKSCELEHAIHIGMEKELIGIDKEGRPILRDRT